MFVTKFWIWYFAVFILVDGCLLTGNAWSGPGIYDSVLDTLSVRQLHQIANRFFLRDIFHLWCRQCFHDQRNTTSLGHKVLPDKRLFAVQKATSLHFSGCSLRWCSPKNRFSSWLINHDSSWWVINHKFRIFWKNKPD